MGSEHQITHAGLFPTEEKKKRDEGTRGLPKKKNPVRLLFLRVLIFKNWKSGRASGGWGALSAAVAVEEDEEAKGEGGVSRRSSGTLREARGPGTHPPVAGRALLPPSRFCSRVLENKKAGDDEKMKMVPCTSGLLCPVQIWAPLGRSRSCRMTASTSSSSSDGVERLRCVRPLSSPPVTPSLPLSRKRIEFIETSSFLFFLYFYN